MRFKKLRILVGIALILFLLIVGNIVAFGKLIHKNPIVQLNNTDQNTILVDPKQIAPKEIQNATRPIQPVKDVQNSSPPKPIEQPKAKIVESTPLSPKPIEQPKAKIVESTPPSPKPVVVHHSTRRTRAS